jgi:hypothetical protein
MKTFMRYHKVSTHLIVSNIILSILFSDSVIIFSKQENKLHTNQLVTIKADVFKVMNTGTVVL